MGTGYATGLPRTVEYLVGAIAAYAVTYGAFRLHLALAAVSSLYLLMVILAAFRWGVWEATAVTIGAFLCLDYFFTDPLFSLRMTNSSQWIALGVFEFVGLLVGRLSGEARQQARNANEERNKIAHLYELSRLVLLIDHHKPPGQQISDFVQNAIGVESVALFDPAANDYGEAGANRPEVRDLARRVWAQDSDSDSVAKSEHTWARVLRAGGRRIGAIAMRKQGLNALTVDAIASIAAIALERSRSLESEARAEAARESDQLRTAVLDALAHSFKTPLTAIRVASSGLLETGVLRPRESALVALIDSESAQLSELANRLLQTARLDKSGVSVQREECRTAGLIESMLERLPRDFEGHSIEIENPGEDLWIRGNGELVVVALLQVVDNALKYSAPGSAVSITTTHEAEEVIISVHNQGPVIGPEDRQCIFERFYRAPSTKYLTPGTGLGLSITRRVAEAHGGHVWVRSDESSGTTFFLALPVSPGAVYESI